MLLEKAKRYAENCISGKEITTFEVKKQCEWFLGDLEKQNNDYYPYYFDTKQIVIIEGILKLLNFATGLEIVSRVQMIGSNYKVLVLGYLADEKSISSNSYNYSNHLLNQLLETNLLFDEEHTLKFINNTFDVKFKSVSASQRNIIKSNPAVYNMKPFPDKSSVKLIDDVIVIKLSDKVSEDK